MNSAEYINEIRSTLKPFKRGILSPVVENKIRENVLTITEGLINSQGLDKFIEISKKMQTDWMQSLSQDIRFGRDEEAQKGLTKLLTMELILSHPKISKEGES